MRLHHLLSLLVDLVYSLGHTNFTGAKTRAFRIRTSLLVVIILPTIHRCNKILMDHLHLHILNSSYNSQVTLRILQVDSLLQIFKEMHFKFKKLKLSRRKRPKLKRKLRLIEVI
jgi:hypothetical protein